jgi:hypothetical protein
VYFKSLNNIEVVNQEVYEAKKGNFIKFAINNGLEKEFLSEIWGIKSC